MIDKEARNKSISFHNAAIPLAGTDSLKAYRLLCSATVADPTMATAWDFTGNALADLKQMEAACAAYKRCLELPEGDSPGDMTPSLRVKAMVNLGHRQVNLGRVEEAEATTRAAIALLEADPSLDQEGYAFAYTNLSLALSFQARHGEAIEYAQRAFELSQEPIIETGLAFTYLFAGDYAKGLRHFQARIDYAPALAQFRNMPYQAWNGEEVGSLLVEADQGMGDSTSFARFIPAASKRVKKLIFRVQPDILRMMTMAFRGLKNVEVIPQSPTFPIAESWIATLSLPVALGLTTEQIRDHPQVWQMPPARSEVPAGWKVKSRKTHIAIAYGGNPMNDLDRQRSVPVTQFLSLYDVPGLQLYSVQCGDRVKDLHEAGCASLIFDMSPYIKEAMDTVAILREMDLVVACESFVAHLAAAADIPCWVPMWSRSTDWRCGRSGDRPIWYPQTRLFWQDADGDWPSAFRKITEALRGRT